MWCLFTSILKPGSLVLSFVRTFHKKAKVISTVEVRYIGSLRTAKFILYIRNPIYTRKFLLFCPMRNENFIRYIRLSDIIESDISEFYCSFPSEFLLEYFTYNRNIFSILLYRISVGSVHILSLGHFPWWMIWGYMQDILHHDDSARLATLIRMRVESMLPLALNRHENYGQNYTSSWKKYIRVMKNLLLSKLKKCNNINKVKYIMNCM